MGAIFTLYYWLKYRTVQAEMTLRYYLQGRDYNAAALAAYYDTHAIWARDVREAEEELEP